MPWIFISFCDNSRGFLSLSHVCECVWWKGLQKQKGNKKNHESTGPLEWALGLWYRQRKTTRSLVQYQTLHRREWFFLFYWFFLKVFFFFFPKWRHPITCGSWPFSLLEFLKVEKTVSFLFFFSQLIHVPYYTEAGMIINVSYCIFFNYSLIVSFFFRTSNKRMKSFMGK